MSDLIVAVLVTLNSKSAEGTFVCEVLSKAGISPWLIDLSLRPHELNESQESLSDVSASEVAIASGTNWEALEKMGRTEAAETMIVGGTKILLEKFRTGELSGVIGVGGANGSTMSCALMRALPPLFPKVMVTPVAATAAVEWYVAESDIAMFPTIGDMSLNRITRAAMENAAWAVAAMAKEQRAKEKKQEKMLPLIGVSSFGGTQLCVNRVTEKLLRKGYEVIHFHSSGPGGKALESLASICELAGVIDITTSELTDLVVGGVYSAGKNRLTAAGKSGLPQVVVPGALDHCNFWMGRAPERYHHREFVQYNVEILLMRTNADEYRALGQLVAERLNAAQGPFAVLIPTQGFSQHTVRKTCDLEGREIGIWKQPETDAVFVETLRKYLKKGQIVEVPAHINDPLFADACVEAFLVLDSERKS